ncbi:hypothetical protein GW7_19561 [Heterocephalus glaber]|uniref:Uncharacterized protein n=1 Tax=Heterocephalus glaber TaxID=10181 RepID=G5AZU3_HETGA|nr:hypothetical protein GW7_19561 [Heterocephalus glaber]
MLPARASFPPHPPRGLRPITAAPPLPPRAADRGGSARSRSGAPLRKVAASMCRNVLLIRPLIRCKSGAWGAGGGADGESEERGKENPEGEREVAELAQGLRPTRRSSGRDEEEEGTKQEREKEEEEEERNGKPSGL